MRGHTFLHCISKKKKKEKTTPYLHAFAALTLTHTQIQHCNTNQYNTIIIIIMCYIRNAKNDD